MCVKEREIERDRLSACVLKRERERKIESLTGRKRKRVCVCEIERERTANIAFIHERASPTPLCIT